jgi:caa(3)-type oxidase subunit IV
MTAPAESNGGGNGAGQHLVTFAALVALTALELGAARLGIDRAARIAALSGLAMAKAATLLLFFMHLRAESRALKLMAVIPLVVAPPFAIVLMLDAVFRVRGAGP